MKKFLFVSAIVLANCAQPDIITGYGIHVYASESGKILSADEIDTRINNVWSRYAGRDAYVDFFNNYLPPFTIQFLDGEIYYEDENGEFQFFTIGVTYTDTLTVMLSFENDWDLCLKGAALEHEFGHIISFVEGDPEADIDHLDNSIWRTVMYAVELDSEPEFCDEVQER